MLVIKNLCANVGDTGDQGSIPGVGGEGNGNLLQYPCLENSMDRGVCQATVPEVSMSQTQLSASSSFQSLFMKICFLVAKASITNWIG